jgi:heme-degrading monooxygenase HmoA
MYAVFGRVEVDSSRADEAAELLNNYTVPMVKQAPGFVGGTWARSADGTHGLSLILFESEEEARAAERAATGPPPGGPVTFVSAEVFEVLAQA